LELTSRLSSKSYKRISFILLNSHLSDKSYGDEFRIEDGILAENEPDATITNDEAKSKPTIQFEEDYKQLSENTCPNLFKMFRGEDRAPTHILNALFSELLSLLGKSDKSVDFVYGNGRCGRAIIVPQAKSQPAFMEYARKFKWIENILDHVAGGYCDVDDAAEWLCYYLGKRHDASFTLASGSLGYPLVQ
jgi:hypothetical protein